MDRQNFMEDTDITFIIYQS